MELDTTTRPKKMWAVCVSSSQLAQRLDAARSPVSNSASCSCFFSATAFSISWKCSCILSPLSLASSSAALSILPNVARGLSDRSLDSCRLSSSSGDWHLSNLSDRVSKSIGLVGETTLERQGDASGTANENAVIPEADSPRVRKAEGIFIDSVSWSNQWSNRWNIASLCFLRTSSARSAIASSAPLDSMAAAIDFEGKLSTRGALEPW